MSDQAPVVLQGTVKKAKSLGVIGITVSIGGKGIVNVHPNTPAEQAGLKKGDKILKVEDKDGRHDIDGPPNSTVVLLVKRAGNETPLVFIITRKAHQEIENKEVRSYFKGRDDYELE